MTTPAPAMTLEEAGQLGPPDKHFRVLCLQSGQVAITDDADPAAQHAAISCPPGSGCCQGEDHDCWADDTPVCHPLVIQAKVVLTGSSAG